MCTRAIRCTTPVQYVARLINIIAHMPSVCQPPVQRRGRGARRNGRRATAPRSASAQRGTADQRPSRASRRPRTAPKNVDKTEQMFYNMYSRLCGQTFLRRSRAAFLRGRFVQADTPLLRQSIIWRSFYVLPSVCQRQNSSHISPKTSAKCRILPSGDRRKT